jgi:hypothetical protein
VDKSLDKSPKRVFYILFSVNSKNKLLFMTFEIKFFGISYEYFYFGLISCSNNDVAHEQNTTCSQTLFRVLFYVNITIEK